ncbi:MAG: multi-sensor signal transduction histidine kinase [Candidatus Sulfotelmatobacter sp.]|nr:multi-sensor signal transduction histidine kinase [Candidatus Sulfotelmatobacter sp.]
MELQKHGAVQSLVQPTSPAMPLLMTKQKMPRSKANYWTNPPSGVKYTVTLVSIASAVIVAWVLWHFWHSEAFASVFFCAIIFSAWFGGFRQGLLGVTVSALAFDYFFLSPTHTFYLDSRQLPRLIIFVVSALIMGFLTASQRSTTESLKRARDDLSTSVEELERINEELRTENSERKLTQAALRHSQAYLAEAQRLSHSGSFGWRVATGEIIWSEETFRIFECARAATPSLDLIFQRVHPDDAIFVKETIERAAQAGKDFDFEHRLLMPDGAVKHVYIVGHAEGYQSKELEYVGAVMDITAAKHSEEALRRSEGYLTDAQRLTRTGSWAWNVASRQSVYWSQENFRLFGFDPETGIPSDEAFYQRVHPEDRDRVRREVFLERPEEGSHFDVEFRIVLPDGAIRNIRSTGHPIRNTSGNLLEYVGTSIDVTERKQADEERERLRLVQADLAHLSRVTTMGELTASLAHEIRQPISAAVTNAKTCLRWLRRDEPDVAEACEAASRIVKDVTRAADIISRISSLFKKGALQRELVDVNELIREMIVLLRSEASRYSIAIRTELAEGLPKVMADRIQLQQVLMNLMLNAIDAMKETTGGGELTIKLEAGNAELLISVSDTGVGLPQEKGEEIFKAFFTTKDDGTGMGLPISRSIIESHGGRLWATGCPGSGATFQFTLPATGAAHA